MELHRDKAVGLLTFLQPEKLPGEKQPLDERTLWTRPGHSQRPLTFKSMFL